VPLLGVESAVQSVPLSTTPSSAFLVRGSALLAVVVISQSPNDAFYNRKQWHTMSCRFVTNPARFCTIAALSLLVAKGNNDDHYGDADKST
jgi:hypothetical protein